MLWIAGPAGAGKTTVTRRLARRHGLRWYNCDAQTWQHLDRAVADGVRNAQQFAALTPEQRRLARPEEIEYDRGPMMLEDLCALPDFPAIVVDGAPPDLAVADSARVVWLLPSRAVQLGRLAQRHPDGVPRRYLQWTRVIEHAQGSGAAIVNVDNLSIEQAVMEVEQVFARQLAEGSRATTAAQRRELIRYTNRTIIGQCRGWLAHQPRPDARLAAQMFDCECARPGCTELVELPVDTAESVLANPPPAILAAGH